MSDLQADLDVALSLADCADTITVARFGALDLHVEHKPDLTPVSDADLAVETALREILAEQRPGSRASCSTNSTMRSSARNTAANRYDTDGSG